MMKTKHAVVCVVSLGLYSGRYSRMATKKNPNFVSQYVMGVVCLHIEDEYDNDRDAVRWLKEAVPEENEGERNFVNAVCLHAIMNFEGRGMAKNSQEAIRLFNKAGTGGCVRAMLWMGKIYDKGDGVEQDSAEAVRWYTTAAENGSAEGQNWLGKLYAAGEGVDVNLERAKKYFELAVEQRLNDAEFNLARILQETDPPSAIELYRRAADGGMAKAQLVLSDAYSKGIGGVVKNRKEAFKWCQKAAEQEVTDAQYDLGML